MPAVAPKSTDTPPLIGISYSKEEEQWKDQLISLLPTDVDFRLISNRVEDFPAGLGEENLHALEEATGWVLLLSPTYLSNSWMRIDQSELLSGLEKKIGLRVLAVLVRNCAWQQISYFQSHQLITNHGKPMAEASNQEQSKLLKDLASRVMELVGVPASEAKPATKTQPKEAPTSPWDLSSDVGNFKVSHELRAIVGWAWLIVSLSELEPREITHESLLVAFAEFGKAGSKPGKPPHMLWKHFSNRLAQYDAVIDQKLPGARRLKEAIWNSHSMPASTRASLQIFQDAATIMRETAARPESQAVCTHHFLAALLNFPSWPPESSSLIDDSGELRKRLASSIKRSHSTDKHAVWARILGSGGGQKAKTATARKSRKTTNPPAAEGNVVGTPTTVQQMVVSSPLSETIETAETPVLESTSEPEVPPIPALDFVPAAQPTDEAAQSEETIQPPEIRSQEEQKEEEEEQEEENVKPLLAGFATDYWSGKDLLNIEDDVNALASLVSAWSVEPPLSIGLFGDWGSGKSHFMRQMRERVEKLSRKARKQTDKKQNEIGYYKNIVQIEFNAWHYIEGNLWASLVDHIFANLRVSEKERLSIVEARRDELMNQLGVKKEIESKIKSRIEERKTRLEAKQREATAVATKAEEKKEVAATQLAGFRSEAENQIDKLKVPVSFSENDKSILKRIGIKPEEWTTAGDFRQHYDEVKGFGNRLLAQWKLFKTDRKVRRRFFLAAVLTLIPTAGLLLTKLEQNIALPARILAAIGVGATILTALLPTWKQFSEALNALEEHDAAVERERQKRIGELQAEVTALAQKVIDAKTEASSIGREIEDLEHQIKTTTTSKILAEFIEDRAAAEDYRRHLGLLALIRRDFEKLRALFDQQRSEEKEGKETHDKNRINRIVLYIDDLDRCPPQRVVEVLQAIHLLLAFPIFVVVVGVDARWVTRSLQESYEWLRLEDDEEKKNEENDRDDERKAEGATPHDYLEKIFQIPFWLRPMEEGVCKSFIEGLTEQIRYRAPGESAHESNGEKKSEVDVDSTELVTPTVSESANGDGESDAAEGEEKVALNGEAAVRTSDSKSTDEQRPEAADDVLETSVVVEEKATGGSEDGVNGEGSSGEHDQDKTVGDENEEDEDDDEEVVDLAPVSLTLSDDEIKYMASLARLISRSPRGVKRFLNCYRLIKVSLPPDELKTFVQEGDSYKYKAVMILLGIITGAPTVSLYVVEELENWKPEDVTSMITDLASKLEENADLAKQPDWSRLKTFLNDLKGKDESAEMFKALRDITPRVSRYSFRIARAEAAGPKRRAPASATRKSKTTPQPMTS